jgi:hypothetical protein
MVEVNIPQLEKKCKGKEQLANSREQRAKGAVRVRGMWVVRGGGAR